MKLALSRFCVLLALLALALVADCADDVNDAIDEATTTKVIKTVTIEDIEANGFTEVFRDIVFAEEIADWDQISAKVKNIDILEVQYQIYGNDGGSGSGSAWASHYQDPSSKRLIGQPSMTGGVDMTFPELLPLEPGALAFLNELADAERFTAYFNGDATDIHFWVRIILKLEVTLDV